MDIDPNPRRVTLQEFSAAVECHFTTASRIRSGARMPGRELFNRIVRTYGLDPAESLRYFCGSREEFGRYMRESVFRVDDADMARDRQLSSIRHKLIDHHNDKVADKVHDQYSDEI